MVSGRGINSKHDNDLKQYASKNGYFKSFLVTFYKIRGKNIFEIVRERHLKEKSLVFQGNVTACMTTL